MAFDLECVWVGDLQASEIKAGTKKREIVRIGRNSDKQELNLGKKKWEPFWETIFDAYLEMLNNNANVLLCLPCKFFT